jgi:hypothetical protein
VTTDTASANDVADVLDTCISIFELDDDPGKLIRAHYVTTEAERMRWLAAFRAMGRLLGDSGAIDACLRCHERPASTENLCRSCTDDAIRLELSCDWLPEDDET